MHTVRMTLNIDEALLKEVLESHPGVTKTELVQRGLRALLAREAAERLGGMGGIAAVMLLCAGSAAQSTSAWREMRPAFPIPCRR
jgi:hypothetical protein